MASNKCDNENLQKEVSNIKINILCESNSKPDKDDTITNGNTKDQNIERNENIVFDFFINLVFTAIDYQSIKTAIAKSINVDNEQVTIQKCEDITHTKPRSRINAMIIANQREIESIGSYLSCVINQGKLSTAIQNVLELKERPQISRFYVRCSNPKLRCSYSVTETPLEVTSQTSDAISQNKINNEKTDNIY